MKMVLGFNKIKYLRKKLKNKNWIKRRIKLLLKCSEDLDTFYKFECSDFFKGHTVASRNRQWYEKRDKQIDRQIRFLESI